MPYRSVAISDAGAAETQAIDLLLDTAQGHLFRDWREGEAEPQKRALLGQALALDRVCLGGLKEYLATCRALLKTSAAGGSPLEGWKPEVPRTFAYEMGSAEFDTAEAAGAAALDKVGFVLVAGGLGERLGYSGIKLALKCEITTEKCFFELYAEFILAYQERAREIGGNKLLALPLAIMTSDDTHEKTIEMLTNHDYFGLDEKQVTLLKQEKVPSILNHNAEMALKSPYELLTKPHGHGDVHALLLNAVLPQWAAAGLEHVFFFQDTNLLVFRGFLCLLGCSILRRLDVNFLVIPRKPGEAVGSVCRLVRAASAKTANVEYNVFEHLLAASGAADATDAAGFSSFPGNANVFVLRLAPYLARLRATGGRMPEYINPKYADRARGLFSSAARLECAMSDYSAQLPSDERVGCTRLERWLCFSAAKNNLADAAARERATGFSESAASAENDLYAWGRRALAAAGCKVAAEGRDEAFAGLTWRGGARVLLRPDLGVSFAEIKARFPSAGEVAVSGRSVLVLGGRGLTLRRLKLDGALLLTARGGAKAEVRGLEVMNNGWRMVRLEGGEEEDLLVRGYKLARGQAVVREVGGDEGVLEGVEKTADYDGGEMF